MAKPEIGQQDSNGRPPPGSITDSPGSDDSAERIFPGRLFFILDTATQLILTARKIKDGGTRNLVRLRRKNAVGWMLRLKVAFGPRWDPRENRRGSRAVCQCLCHLYSAVAQCYEAMSREVVKILPLFTFWADEDLISEDWFEGHVISKDRKRFSLTNRELARITRPIEQSADDIDHHIGNLRDMVWREFKDWPRRVRSPAASDPSPRVQKAPPALPRSPTPEVVADRPELAADGGIDSLGLPALSDNGSAATPPETTGQSPEATADQNAIDFDALTESLLRKNHVHASKLVRLMRDRATAPFQDVADQVHGREVSDEAVRSMVNRVNNKLHDLESRLRFRTKDSHVIREIAIE
jgi:hypothetical protein